MKGIFASILASYASAVCLKQSGSNCSDLCTIPAMCPPYSSTETLNKADFTHDSVIIWLHGAGGCPSEYQATFNAALPEVNRNFDLFTPIA